MCIYVYICIWYVLRVLYVVFCVCCVVLSGVLCPQSDFPSENVTAVLAKSEAQSAGRQMDVIQIYLPPG
jgi:hypothetical protein